MREVITLIKLKMLKYILLFIMLLLSYPAACEDVVIITRETPYKTIAGSEFIVQLTIDKGSITGFGTVEERLPQGFTATAIQTNRANFVFDNQVARFFWMSLPEENEIVLLYKVSISSEVYGTKLIGGTFEYFKDKNSKVIDIPPNKIFIENQTIDTSEMAALLAHSDSIQAKENLQIVSTEMVINDYELQVDETPDLKADKITATTIKLVSFSVQIASSFNKIPVNYFRNQYSIEEQIKSEFHNGMYKYTIGSFYNYKSARDHVNFIRNKKGVDGAFITAYKNGKRITIQEALELIKQH